jgi:hypothetical protein
VLHLILLSAGILSFCSGWRSESLSLPGRSY